MNLRHRQQRAYLRAYNDKDRAAIDHVFRVTADAGLQASPDPRTLEYGSHIWCHPYPFLHQDHCFVVAVEDEIEVAENESSTTIEGKSTSTSTSKAVGYILSTPDTQAYSTAYKRFYFPTLKPEITTPLPPDADVIWRPDNLPNALLYKIQHSERWPAEIESDVPGVLERYPAHLHIDILPEWQRMGWGTALMDACLKALKKKGARGCHLQMVEGNVAARAFYKAVGFRRWGDEGKAEWCMVIDL